MEPAKTVSIVCPENQRAGYKNIPAAEFDPAIHVLFDRETGLPVESQASSDDQEDDGPTTTDGATHTAKGPGGRWYVMAGDARASKGFQTEDEAKAALAEMQKVA